MLYTNIFFETEEEAKEVLKAAKEIINTYGHVTLLDVYDLSGICGKYLDMFKTWTDITDARIEKTTGGYEFILPDLETNENLKV